MRVTLTIAAVAALLTTGANASASVQDNLIMLARLRAGAVYCNLDNSVIKINDLIDSLSPSGKDETQLLAISALEMVKIQGVNKGKFCAIMSGKFTTAFGK